MSFDRRKRGRGRDKREGFGDEGFDGYQDFGGKPPERNFGNGYQDRGGGFDRGGPPERKSFGEDSGGGFQNRGPRPGGGGMPAQVVGTGTGEVKFFNSQKGFGFIKVDGRPDDVFVHISAVEAAGLQGLAEGQPLSFTLVDRGGRVSATELVIDGEPLPVSDSGGAPRENRGGGGGRSFEGDGERGPRRQLTGESDTGTVKFFNDVKGFGFIVRDGGGDDAFVHISAVERSGMGSLAEGDRVKFDIEVDRRGKYAAVNLSRADS